ncbi:MAG TPA: PepSY-associated TM helix domain-containing protein [Candidatus Cybelea sp.]|jgi:vanillate O-demethylase ferredoxin subunit
MRPLLRVVTWIHRWTGLAVGIIVVFLAVTGAAMVFRAQLEARIDPGLLTIAPCSQSRSLDSIVAAARSAHRGKVSDVFLYGSPVASTMVRFADNDQIYVDGCTARVLGEQARYAGFFGSLESLHKGRFAKRAGKLAARTGAFGLAALLILGIFAWWPRRKRALAFNPQLRGRALVLNVHTTLGAYASIALLVAAATAIPISLGWSPEKNLVPALPKRFHDPPAVTFERDWRAARSAIPQAFRWASIRVPRTQRPMEIVIVTASAPHDEAHSFVYVDPRNARVLASYPYDKLDAATKLRFWLLAVHTGRAGGPLVESLLFLGMIAVPALAYTALDSFVRGLAMQLRHLPRAATPPRPARSLPRR